MDENKLTAAHGSDDIAGENGEDVQPAQATPAGDGVQARDQEEIDIGNAISLEAGYESMRGAKTAQDVAWIVEELADAHTDNATLRAQLAAANARAEKASAALQRLLGMVQQEYAIDRSAPGYFFEQLIDVSLGALTALADATPDADTEADDAVAEDSAQRSV